MNITNVFTNANNNNNQNSPKPNQFLVQFKAGKLNRGTGNWVNPDPRNGLVYLNVEEDGLLHFYWKDLKTNLIEDDLIIFPSEATFMHVEQSNDRVYMLAFESSSQKHFFWLQEAVDKNDRELAILVNKAILDPTALQEQLQQTNLNNSSGSSPLAVSDQAQLIQLLQQMGSESTNSTTRNANTTNTAGSTSQSQMQQLAGILSGIQVPQGEPDIDLSDILTVDRLGPVLRDPEACRALFPHLPAEAPQSSYELEDTIRSPQFVQSMQSLSYALRSGQLSNILSAMGLNASNMRAGVGGVEALIQAIIARRDEDSNSSLHPSNSHDSNDNNDEHQMDTS